ncbi:MAG: class I SAM-dependent methyltransferase [Candidatus Thorarchaeota archaeon]
MDLDKIYSETPLNEIPWNYETPPDSLVDLLNRGEIKPCKTIDFGCGVGSYALYLATEGFDVTGIDISPIAISISKKRAIEKGVKCNFLVADIVGNFKILKDKFDFAYDWELLHHIFPEKRKKFVKNVYKLLNQKAKYLSVCFSEKDSCFGGQEKYRETPIGTVLYFSSREELEILFKPFFRIIELKTIEIRGKPVTHIANYAFMERK